MGSFLCATLAGLLGALVGGGSSVTLGGVYLRELFDAVELRAGVGGGGALLPWVAFDEGERGGVAGGGVGGVVCCGGKL